MYPIIPLALAARDAGHDVSIATAEPFVTRLAALGLRKNRIFMGTIIEIAAVRRLETRWNL